MNIALSQSQAQPVLASEPLVVVLDAMGVIYQSGDDVGELLIPFARERGCSLSDEHITKIYTDCSLGDFTSKEFWKRLGISNKERDLDGDYLRGHRLVDGLLPFLQAMERSRIPIGCISNDVSEWSQQLRQAFKIDDYLFNWTISGDVGIRKPDAGIFEHFLRATGLNPQRCVFVDDRVKNLDAASRLGFRTCHFSPIPLQEAGAHPVIKSFDELTRHLENLGEKS